MHCDMELMNKIECSMLGTFIENGHQILVLVVSKKKIRVCLKLWDRMTTFKKWRIAEEIEMSSPKH